MGSNANDVERLKANTSSSAQKQGKVERSPSKRLNRIADFVESVKSPLNATNTVQSKLSGSHEDYDSEFEQVCRSLCTKGFIYAEWGNKTAKLVHEGTGREVTITIK